MIQFIENRQVFHLTTPHTSYVMAVADGTWLGHLYYGPKLADTAGMERAFRLDEFPFSPAVNERDKVRFTQLFPYEYSTFGCGDFREPCLSVENEYGMSGVELTYRSFEIIPGKVRPKDLPHTRGSRECCDTLDLLMTDDALGLDVHLLYTVYTDLDVIVRSVKVANRGDAPVVLKRVLSGQLNTEPEECEVLTLHGSWGRERTIVRQALKTGAVSAESIRGVSSAEDSPFLAILSPGTTQTMGEVWGMSLIYSGNFLAKAQIDQTGRLRCVMGIHPESFSWPLAPGNDFQSPEVCLVYSGEGLGGMTRTFHDLYRNHLIEKRWLTRERPVLVNNWEATMMNFDTDVLIGFARAAKEAGIDMLVMDDGWFGHRDDDTSSLGDWFVDERKLKGGLKKLVDAVNEMGLKFGIWIEPEMVNEDSELFRAHPDWRFQLPNRKPGALRQQYVLDLTRQEVWDGVYNQIHDTLSSANIAYVKWDMNRYLSDVGSMKVKPGCQGQLLHRYVLAVYRMQERLPEDFPDLLLENCSSGGARFDAGMLFFSPQIWTSDDTDAIERLSIQEGTALVFPLSTMGAHVSVCPNQQTGRSVPFDTRAKVAMAGTFGYEMDVRNMDPEEKALIPGQVELFRKVHPVVREGDYYRIASFRENHSSDCWMVVKKDRSLAYMTYIQVLAAPNRPGVKVRMQGLDPEAVYEVVCDYDGAMAAHNGEMETGPQASHHLGRMNGDTLMKHGIIVPRVRGDYQALLYEIRKVMRWRGSGTAP